MLFFRRAASFHAAVRCSMISSARSVLIVLLAVSLALAVSAQSFAPTTPAREATPTVPPVVASAPLPADPVLSLPPTEALADTLSARGRYLLAIRVYEALPPTAAIKNKLGVACEHMMLYDKARASFDEAVRMNPRYAEAYNNMGTLAHSQGDLSRAEKMYKKSLKIKPDAPSTLKNLGTLYYAEHKYKKGDDAYHRAVALDPEALEHASGRDIQAPSKAQSASEMHYHMAMTYAQAGSRDLALQYLRKAIGEGFHDRNRLLHDKEFADLRTSENFLKLVDDLKNN